MVIRAIETKFRPGGKIIWNTGPREKILRIYRKNYASTRITPSFHSNFYFGFTRNLRAWEKPLPFHHRLFLFLSCLLCKCKLRDWYKWAKCPLKYSYIGNTPNLFIPEMVSFPFPDLFMLLRQMCATCGSTASKSAKDSQNLQFRLAAQSCNQTRPLRSFRRSCTNQL